jgi:hypothetical protein
MGLDMYLESHQKETYDLYSESISFMQKILNYRHKDSKEVFVDDDEWAKAKDSVDALIDHKQEQIAYWRKANQIRGWFSELLGEESNGVCKGKVSKENIESLLNTCKQVLADHSLAEKLLSVTEGFFFGSYEYDEYYFEQIKETVEICERVLKEFDFNTNYLIYDEWW